MAAVLFAVKNNSNLSVCFPKAESGRTESALEKVTKKGEAKTTPITEFSLWARALSRILVEVAPTNGPLAADRRYQEVIAGLAEQFKWQAVLDLDIAWRKKIHRDDLATRDNFAYHLVDATLIATFCNAAQAKATGSKAPAGTSTEFRSASGGAPKIVRPQQGRLNLCRSCLAPSHPGRPCPPNRVKVCWAFNAGGCSNQDCKRRHACQQCGKDHPATTCTGM